MGLCAGIKWDGGRCTTVVKPPQTHCYQHDPDRAEERRRNASRAGRSAGGRDIRDLKRRISEVVDAVLEGSQDRGRAAVAIQGFNALRGVLDLERKVKETEAGQGDGSATFEELYAASSEHSRRALEAWIEALEAARRGEEPPSRDSPQRSSPPRGLEYLEDEEVWVEWENRNGYRIWKYRNREKGARP